MAVENQGLLECRAEQQEVPCYLVFSQSEFDLTWERSGKGRGRFTLVWQIASVTGPKMPLRRARRPC
jgi:hypothetical protein